MATGLFKRPVIDRTEIDKKLERDIFEKTRRNEQLDGEYLVKYELLEKKYALLKSEKEKEISDLENVLSFKRQERVALTAPLVEREKSVSLREDSVSQREQSIASKEQSVLSREQEAQSMITHAENLSDELGDATIDIARRDKIVLAKEKALREKENEYLLKVDAFHAQSASKDLEISEKLDFIRTRSYQLDDKEKSLNEKEKQLNDLDRAVKDKYATLEITLNHIKNDTKTINK